MQGTDGQPQGVAPGRCRWAPAASPACLRRMPLARAAVCLACLRRALAFLWRVAFLWNARGVPVTCLRRTTFRRKVRGLHSIEDVLAVKNQ